ncbi:MAG: glycosyltransferase family 4 protein [Candidatus Omnitrophica bacterium]|nr:glycosyltransferase family 4 protein [Candidatus Omnitrophota bacterium]
MLPESIYGVPPYRIRPGKFDFGVAWELISRNGKGGEFLDRLEDACLGSSIRKWLTKAWHFHRRQKVEETPLDFDCLETGEDRLFSPREYPEVCIDNRGRVKVINSAGKILVVSTLNKLDPLCRLIVSSPVASIIGRRLSGNENFQSPHTLHPDPMASSPADRTQSTKRKVQSEQNESQRYALCPMRYAIILASSPNVQITKDVIRKYFPGRYDLAITDLGCERDLGFLSAFQKIIRRHVKKAYGIYYYKEPRTDADKIQILSIDKIGSLHVGKPKDMHPLEATEQRNRLHQSDIVIVNAASYKIHLYLKEAANLLKTGGIVLWRFEVEDFERSRSITLRHLAVSIGWNVSELEVPADYPGSEYTLAGPIFILRRNNGITPEEKALGQNQQEWVISEVIDKAEMFRPKSELAKQLMAAVQARGIDSHERCAHELIETILLGKNEDEIAARISALQRLAPEQLELAPSGEVFALGEHETRIVRAAQGQLTTFELDEFFDCVTNASNQEMELRYARLIGIKGLTAMYRHQEKFPKQWRRFYIWLSIEGKTKSTSLWRDPFIKHNRDKPLDAGLAVEISRHLKERSTRSLTYLNNLMALPDILIGYLDKLSEAAHGYFADITPDTFETHMKRGSAIFERIEGIVVKNRRIVTAELSKARRAGESADIIQALTALLSKTAGSPEENASLLPAFMQSLRSVSSSPEIGRSDGQSPSERRAATNDPTLIQQITHYLENLHVEKNQLPAVGKLDGKKIVLYTHNQRGTGGVESITIRWIADMLRRNALTIELVAIKDDDKDVERAMRFGRGILNINMIETGNDGLRNLQILEGKINSLFDRNPDAVFSHSFWKDETVVMFRQALMHFLANGRFVPCVFVRHLAGPLYWESESELARLATLIGAPSFQSVKDLQSAGYDNVRYVGPTINVDYFDPEHPDLKGRGELFKSVKGLYALKGTVLGYTHRIVEEKGARETLMALKSLNLRGYNNVSCVFAGSHATAFFAELKSYCRDKGLAYRVISQKQDGELELSATNSSNELVDALFIPEGLNQASLRDLYNLLRKRGIEVLAGNWPEGNSQALLEAQAMGVPVVATRIGGNPESIVDGRTGKLIDFKYGCPESDEIGANTVNAERLADALVDMINMDSTRREEINRQARVHVLNNFHPDKMAANYENLILEAIDTAKTAFPYVSPLASPRTSLGSSSLAWFDYAHHESPRASLGSSSPENVGRMADAEAVDQEMFESICRDLKPLKHLKDEELVAYLSRLEAESVERKQARLKQHEKESQRKPDEPYWDWVKRVYLFIIGNKPRDVVELERSPTRLVLAFKNNCPVLAACIALGLQTSFVCKSVYHNPCQRLLSENLDSRLKFDRNYENGLRPAALYCIEILTIDLSPDVVQQELLQHEKFLGNKDLPPASSPAAPSMQMQIVERGRSGRYRNMGEVIEDLEKRLLLISETPASDASSPALKGPAWEAFKAERAGQWASSCVLHRDDLERFIEQHAFPCDVSGDGTVYVPSPYPALTASARELEDHYGGPGTLKDKFLLDFGTGKDMRVSLFFANKFGALVTTVEKEPDFHRDAKRTYLDALARGLAGNITFAEKPMSAFDLGWHGFDIVFFFYTEPFSDGDKFRQALQNKTGEMKPSGVLAILFTASQILYKRDIFPRLTPLHQGPIEIFPNRDDIFFKMYQARASSASAQKRDFLAQEAPDAIHAPKADAMRIKKQIATIEVKVEAFNRQEYALVLARAPPIARNLLSATDLASFENILEEASPLCNRVMPPVCADNFELLASLVAGPPLTYDPNRKRAENLKKALLLLHERLAQTSRFITNNIWSINFCHGGSGFAWVEYKTNRLFYNSKKDSSIAGWVNTLVHETAHLLLKQIDSSISMGAIGETICDRYGYLAQKVLFPGEPLSLLDESGFRSHWGREQDYIYRYLKPDYLSDAEFSRQLAIITRQRKPLEEELRRLRLSLRFFTASSPADRTQIPVRRDLLERITPQVWRKMFDFPEPQIYRMMLFELRGLCSLLTKKLSPLGITASRFVISEISRQEDSLAANLRNDFWYFGNHPRFGEIICADEGDFILLELEPGQNGVVFSIKHGNCTALTVRAERKGKIVIGHAHIFPKQAAIDAAYWQYIKILDFLSNPENGFRNVRLAYGWDEDLDGFGFADRPDVFYRARPEHPEKGQAFYSTLTWNRRLADFGVREHFPDMKKQIAIMEGNACERGFKIAASVARERNERPTDILTTPDWYFLTHTKYVAQGYAEYPMRWLSDIIRPATLGAMPGVSSPAKDNRLPAESFSQLRQARGELLAAFPALKFPGSVRRMSPEYRRFREIARKNVFSGFRYFGHGREWLVFDSDSFPHLVFKIRRADSLWLDHCLSVQLLLASALLGQDFREVDHWQLRKMPMFTAYEFSGGILVQENMGDSSDMSALAEMKQFFDSKGIIFVDNWVENLRRYRGEVALIDFEIYVLLPKLLPLLADTEVITPDMLEVTSVMELNFVFPCSTPGKIDFVLPASHYIARVIEGKSEEETLKVLLGIVKGSFCPCSARVSSPADASRSLPQKGIATQKQEANEDRADSAGEKDFSEVNEAGRLQVCSIINRHAGIDIAPEDICTGNAKITRTKELVTDLADAAQAGNLIAAAILLKLFKNVIRTHASRFCTDREGIVELETAVWDAFIYAKAAEKYNKEKGRFATFLSQVCKSKMLRQSRQGDRRRDIELLSEVRRHRGQEFARALSPHGIKEAVDLVALVRTDQKRLHARDTLDMSRSIEAIMQALREQGIPEEKIDIYISFILGWKANEISRVKNVSSSFVWKTVERCRRSVLSLWQNDALDFGIGDADKYFLLAQDRYKTLKELYESAAKEGVLEQALTPDQLRFTQLDLLTEGISDGEAARAMGISIKRLEPMRNTIRNRLIAAIAGLPR